MSCRCREEEQEEKLLPQYLVHGPVNLKLKVSSLHSYVYGKSEINLLGIKK
jgi:hypothetical protein